MQNITKKLLIEEKKKKKDLKLAALAIFLSVSSLQPIYYYQLPMYSAIIDNIRDGDVPANKRDKTLIEIAAATLLSKIISTISYNMYEDDALEYEAAVSSALDDNAWKIDQIARTELFRYHNENIIAEADVDSQFQWNAILDKFTCKTCWGRNGQIYTMDELPDIPAHTNCRCILETI